MPQTEMGVNRGWVLYSESLQQFVFVHEIHKVIHYQQQLLYFSISIYL